MSQTLEDTPSYMQNGVRAIAVNELASGASSGSPYDGIGSLNAGSQDLANRTAYLWGRQNTNISNITALQALVNILLARWTNSTTFTSNSTWIVPANITLVEVELWGGGAGAVGGQGASGAGGGRARGVYSVVPGAAITIIVGAGGVGAAVLGGAADGGTSSFGALISASGGTAGNAGPGPGGVGVGGNIYNMTGQAGTDLQGNILNAVGGNAPAGGMGGTVNSGGGVSLAPTAPGGGGGASSTSATGQNGAQGWVTLRW